MFVSFQCVFFCLFLVSFLFLSSFVGFLFVLFLVVLLPSGFCVLWSFLLWFSVGFSIRYSCGGELLGFVSSYSFGIRFLF